jgi:hypothetical protein
MQFLHDEMNKKAHMMKKIEINNCKNKSNDYNQKSSQNFGG